MKITKTKLREIIREEIQFLKELKIVKLKGNYTLADEVLDFNGEVYIEFKLDTKKWERKYDLSMFWLWEEDERIKEQSAKKLKQIFNKMFPKFPFLSKNTKKIEVDTEDDFIIFITYPTKTREERPSDKQLGDIEKAIKKIKVPGVIYFRDHNN